MSHATAGGNRQPLPTSSLSAPYALIRAGHPRPDRRPSTRLAFLTGVITSRGEVRAWRGIEMHPDGTLSGRTPHRIEARDILATFCVCPNSRAINRARRDLSRPRGRTGEARS